MNKVIKFPIKDVKHIKLGTEYVYHSSYCGDGGLARDRVTDKDLDKLARELLACSTLGDGTREFSLYQRISKNDYNTRIREYCAKRVRASRIYT